MAYTTIPKVVILCGKAFTTTLASLIRTNFIDHESRIVSLEGVMSIVPSGIIIQGAQPSAPAGYLPCDGLAVNRAEFATLFAIIGISYGPGNGFSTFNVPDLRGRTPAGKGAAESIGDSHGEEAVKLANSEVPTHGHSIEGDSHTHQKPDGNDVGIDAIFANPGSSVSQDIDFGPTESSTTGMTIDSSGGDGEHNNMQPSIVINWFIKT